VKEIIDLEKAELSYLLMLSQSIGQSYDLGKNCSYFLEALLKHPRIEQACIWLDTKDKSLCQLKYALPAIPNVEAYAIELIHPFMEKLKQNQLILIESHEPIFKMLSLKDDSPNGYFLARRLGDVGFLKIYSPDKMIYEKCNHIDQIIGRFIHSLEGCTMQTQLKMEVAMRAKAEKRLQDNVILFQRGADSLGEGILVIDLDGIVVFVNQRMEEMAGLTKAEMMGKVGYELFLREDNWNFIKENQKERKKGIPGQYEIQYLHKDKTLKWARVQASPFRDEKGEIIGTISAISDIAEERKTKEDLLESEEKYRELFENMMDGVVILDEQGYITDSNKEAQRILEIEKDEKLWVPSIVHEEDKEKSAAYFKLLQTEGQYTNYEGRVWSSKGTLRHLEVSSSAILDENGKFIGSRDVFRDISDKVKVREELNDFAYIVSHDLKAPLRAIGSLADWVYEDSKDCLNEDGKEQLMLIKQRVLRLHGMIDAILEYSRVGRIKETIEKINLEIELKKIIELLVLPKNVKVHFAKEFPTIQSSKVRLLQVFQNLIGNAIKYNEKEEGNIILDWSENETHYQFSVKDNGVGIDEKYFDKIFKIFQTLAPRDKVESTGVGLSIVKKIVENLKGTVWIESTLNIGTTFYFTIIKNPE